MDKKNTQNVFHVRSAAGIIRVGYALFSEQFRRLLRRSWLVAVVYALVCGLAGRLIVSLLPMLAHADAIVAMGSEAMRHQLTVLLAETAVALVAFVVAAIVLAACGFSLLKSHAESVPVKWYGRVDRQVLLRTAAAIGVSLVCLLLTGAVFASGLWAVSRVLGGIAATAASCLLALVAMLLPVPLAYAVPRWVLSGEQMGMAAFRKGWSTGLRHYATCFVVVIVVLLVTGLLTLVVQLPENVMVVAHLSSQAGALHGDPPGLPEYMDVLSPIVFSVMGFIQAFIHLSMLFPLFYLYGSVEQQERERAEVVRGS